MLDRNPNYRGPRPRRPARIVYLTGVPAAKAVALADGDQADLVPWDYDPHSPLAPGGALARRPAAAATTPCRARASTWSPSTRAGRCSAGARLRRAANYALDRRALAGIFDEPATDHLVPARRPGSRAGARSIRCPARISRRRGGWPGAARRERRGCTSAAIRRTCGSHGSFARTCARSASVS